MDNMFHSTVLICLVVFGVCVEAQPDPNICIPGPGDAKGHRLPTIPEQFKLTVFAYFGGKNYTIASTEYYDTINNQASIWTTYNGELSPGHHGGRESRSYYDYNDTQYYTVTPSKSEFGSYACETRDTNSSHMGKNGHLKSAKDVFRFGEMYNETYMGTDTIDYKKVDWWSTCIYESFGNFTTNYKIDFYFEAGKHNASIPMRLVINGTGSYPMPHSFYHVYDYRDVDIGPQPQEQFLPPVGVMCPGRVHKKPIPDAPDYFSLSWERVTKSRKRISYRRDYYKYDEKLVAHEFTNNTGKGRFHFPTRVVNDYNTGISYQIDYDNSCNVTPISIYSRESKSGDHQHVSLMSPSDFFGLHSSDVDWIYEGRTVNRDVVLDVWQSYRTKWKPWKYIDKDDVTVNSTWLYSFLVDGWKVDGGIPPWHDGMLPVRLAIDYVAYNTKTGARVGADGLIFNYYQASEYMFEHSFFDVGICYNHFNQSMHLAFTLEGKDTYNKYIANNTWHFNNGLIQSIAESIDVSQTRIANLQIVNGFKDLSTIFFTLLDRPVVKGDAINATDPGPLLGTAYKQLDLLVNSKDGSKLTIEFILHEKIMKVNAVSGSLREETEPWMKTKPVGLSIGTVVGVAIGTFIIGGIVSLVCAFAIFKRKTREVPYGVQD